MSLTFTGSGSVFISSNNTVLSNIKPLSVSAWVFPTVVGGAENGGAVRLFTKSGIESATVGGPTFQIGVQAGLTVTEFIFFTTIASLDVTSTSNVISTGRWNHVAMTWDGSLTATNVKLYIGGTEVIYNGQVNGSGVLDDDSLNDLYLTNRNTFARALSGQCMEMAFWKSVLTPSEIKQLYTSRVKGIPLQIQASSLVCYFPMDDYPGGLTTTVPSNIFDQGPNHLVGILTNGLGGAAPKAVSENFLSYQP